MSSGPAGGVPLLRPVPLQELRLRADSIHWPVDQKLAELDSLTPVRGQIRVRHLGGVLEVEGEAETIVTLCCDRCLQHFNRPLQAAVHELLELAGPEAAELEGSDLTALAASAAGPGASGRRSRDPGSGAGASGASAPGKRAAGHSPATGRDRSRPLAPATSDRPPGRVSGTSNASRSENSPRSGSAPRFGSVARNGTGPDSQRRRAAGSSSHPEPLLIEALDDRLDPRGDFDPERWLFEQLSLQLPVVNRCGADCPGPPLAAAGGLSSLGISKPSPLLQGQSSEGSPPLTAGPSPQTGATRLGSELPQAISDQALADADPSALVGGSADPTTTSDQADTSASEPPIDPRWAALRQLLP